MLNVARGGEGIFLTILTDFYCDFLCSSYRDCVLFELLDCQIAGSRGVDGSCERGEGADRCWWIFTFCLGFLHR